MPKAAVSRVGEKFVTNDGLNIEIVFTLNNRNNTVRFDDGTLVEGKEYADIQKGKVKNPNTLSVYGVGYMGQGSYKGREHKGGKTKAHNTWSKMIGRCYSEKGQEQNPTYKDVTVCEEWHNFQNFAKWFDDNYNPETMVDWQLDKDILLKGNRIYSPETCTLVPNEINSIFKSTKSYRGDCPIGVSKDGSKYKASIKNPDRTQKHLGMFSTKEEAFQSFKEEKEKYVKQIADDWRDKIDPRVYKAMREYTVDITD